MNHSFPLLFIALLGLAFSSLQADPVPQFISYQGKLSGAGDSSVTPIRRKMAFKLYDDPTAGTLVWDEQQFVTIANDEFSVLLGNGTDLTSGKHEALDKIFSSATTGLYLELVVMKDAPTSADTTITPPPADRHLGLRLPGRQC